MNGSVYEFGDFRLDAHQRRCFRRTDAKPVTLQPRAFETLRYLVEHAGELVEKSTLLAALWPGTVVEENSLNKQISAVRRALGDSGDDYIVTVPGRGYQLVAPVRVLGTPQESTQEEAPSGTLPASVAVLPFANVTGDPTKDYLGDGLAEELINTLARVPRLEVSARTSSFAYRAATTDVREIARDLRVATVLEGSVRSAGDRIRVIAQLIDGHTGYHVWSQAFDRKARDLFELQEELASAIVQALRVAFDGTLPVIPRMSLPPTRDLEAYRLYLQGASLTARGTVQDHEQSRALMRRSIDRDSDFAHAHAGLAYTEATGVRLHLLPLSTLASAEAAARRALVLDPDLALAHAALGMVQSMRGKFVDAERSFQRARTLDAGNPHFVHSHLFFVHEPVGRVQLAYEESIMVHRLAPAWVPGAVHLGVIALIAGYNDVVLRQIDRATRLGFPITRPPMPELRAHLALRSGNFAQLDDYLNVEPLAPESARNERDVLRQVFRAIADPACKPAALDKMQGLVQRLSGDKSEWVTWMHLVMGYAQLGELDRAFECARLALDFAERWGAVGPQRGLLWMPELRAFREDARFPALARRLGLTDFWEACGPPDTAPP